MNGGEIFFNADVGEGAGADAQIIPLVGGVNISCGAHAGSPAEIDQAVELATKLGKIIGAHPGYPDRENYGRVDLRLSDDALKATLHTQLQNLDEHVQKAGGTIDYIKPHGALYNRMARDYDFSITVIHLLLSWRALPIMVLAGSAAERAAKDAGATVLREGFLDRGYTDSGELVQRGQPGAMIIDPSVAIAHAKAFLQRHPIQSVSGTSIEVEVDSICVHGDTEGALDLLREVLLECFKLGRGESQ